jgi:hypothetical protein
VATATRRIRLELPEPEARALRAVVHEALGAGVLAPELAGAADAVRAGLGWALVHPSQGERA